jgi:hypothetical protein
VSVVVEVVVVIVAEPLLVGWDAEAADWLDAEVADWLDAEVADWLEPETSVDWREAMAIAALALLGAAELLLGEPVKVARCSRRRVRRRCA